MAVFPTIPVPSYPMSIDAVWKTYISETETGTEQRRQKWLFSKYNVNVSYDLLDLDEVEILWAFYQARKGAYEAFYIFDLAAQNHSNLYVGTSDGTIGIFDIPGKNISNLEIYINNLLQLETSEYTVSAGTAEGGADQVVFVATPPQGAVVTCVFNGALRCRVRFSEDKFTRENFEAALYRTGTLNLIGLPMA